MDHDARKFTELRATVDQLEHQLQAARRDIINYRPSPSSPVSPSSPLSPLRSSPFSASSTVLRYAAAAASTPPTRSYRPRDDAAFSAATTAAASALSLPVPVPSAFPGSADAIHTSGTTTADTTPNTAASALRPPPPCCCARSHAKIDTHPHIMPPPGAFYEPWKTTAGEWITLDYTDSPTQQQQAQNARGVAMMSYELGRPPKLFRPVAANLYDVEERIRDMDRDGVARQILSVPPAMWRYDLQDDADLARRWCTAVNEYLAAIVAQHPTRFSGLGIVPLQFPEAAAAVACEALELGLVGVSIGTHVPQWAAAEAAAATPAAVVVVPSEREQQQWWGGDGNPGTQGTPGATPSRTTRASKRPVRPVSRWELGDTALTPFFAACAERRCPVMVHPWYMCQFQQEDRMTPLPGGGEIAGKGAHWAPWLVGMGAEEANCVLSLTASGLLHRFPDLKILLTHGGGAFPALKGRIEQGIRCRRDWVWPVIGNHFEAMGESERFDTLDDYMDRIWVDSITHDPVRRGVVGCNCVTV